MKTAIALPLLRHRACALLAAASVGVTGLAATTAESDAHVFGPQRVPTRQAADLVTSPAGLQGPNQVKIENKGTKASGGFYVRVAWANGATTKSLVWVSGISPGGFAIITCPHIGTYGYNGGVLVTADSTKLVPELSESNNDASGYNL